MPRLLSYVTISLLGGLLLISCKADAQNALSQPYSFLGPQGKITRIWQGHDTLYQQLCAGECINGRFAYIERSRIVRVVEQEEFRLVLVESLDSIPLTTDPYPATRFSVVALRGLTPVQVGFQTLHRGSTRQQVDALRFQTDSLRSKFYLTFFSQPYLDKLKRFPPLQTQQDADRLWAQISSPDYRAVVQAWRRTDTNDLYATVLIQEIMNRACLQLGISPWLINEKLERFPVRPPKR